MGDMARVVVDTSILVEQLRIGGNSKYAVVIDKIEPVISFVTITELYSGKSSLEPIHSNQIEILLRGIEVRIASIARAKSAGRLRALYSLSLADAFIAELALEQNLPLLSLDIKDFSRVKDLRIY